MQSQQNRKSPPLSLIPHRIITYFSVSILVYLVGILITKQCRFQRSCPLESLSILAWMPLTSACTSCRFSVAVFYFMCMTAQPCLQHVSPIIHCSLYIKPNAERRRWRGGRSYGTEGIQRSWQSSDF